MSNIHHHRGRAEWSWAGSKATRLSDIGDPVSFGHAIDPDDSRKTLCGRQIYHANAPFYRIADYVNCPDCQYILREVARGVQS